MVVRLCQCITDAVALHVLALRLKNALVDIRVCPFQPGPQGWSHIKAHCGKVACLCVGSVALFSDAFVEVAIGRCPWLLCNQASERVFPWWLVEVAVDAQVCQTDSSIKRWCDHSSLEYPFMLVSFFVCGNNRFRVSSVGSGSFIFSLQSPCRYVLSLLAVHRCSCQRQLFDHPAMPDVPRVSRQR